MKITSYQQVPGGPVAVGAERISAVTGKVIWVGLGVFPEAAVSDAFERAKTELSDRLDEIENKQREKLRSQSHPPPNTSSL